jgi:hypothetical protein
VLPYDAHDIHVTFVMIEGHFAGFMGNLPDPFA